MTPNVSDLAINRSEQEKVDHVVGLLDSLFRQGKFNSVDAILLSSKVEELPAAVLMALMVTSYHAKEHLFERDNFLNRAEAQLRVLLGDDQTNHLLRFIR